MKLSMSSASWYWFQGFNVIRAEERSSITLKEKGGSVFRGSLLYAFFTRILPHAFCKKENNKNERERQTETEKGRYEY